MGEEGLAGQVSKLLQEFPTTNKLELARELVETLEISPGADIKGLIEEVLRRPLESGERLAAEVLVLVIKDNDYFVGDDDHLLGAPKSGF